MVSTCHPVINLSLPVISSSSSSTNSKGNTIKPQITSNSTKDPSSVATSSVTTDLPIVKPVPTVTSESIVPFVVKPNDIVADTITMFSDTTTPSILKFNQSKDPVPSATMDLLVAKNVAFKYLSSYHHDPADTTWIASRKPSSDLSIPKGLSRQPTIDDQNENMKHYHKQIIDPSTLNNPSTYNHVIINHGPVLLPSSDLVRLFSNPSAEYGSSKFEGNHTNDDCFIDVEDQFITPDVLVDKVKIVPMQVISNSDVKKSDVDECLDYCNALEVVFLIFHESFVVFWQQKSFVLFLDATLLFMYS